jgi:hypothetical protein
MSYRTWTADALLSNFQSLSGECWRIVEAQNRVSTLKLVDTFDEQRRLEELLEDKKPPYPPEMADFHYLLFTPFRYEPYDRGSRFRRRGQKDGVFYASETVDTAMAEMAFYRLLFFLESPSTPIPDNPGEYTAFSVNYSTDKGLDLTAEPLVRDQKDWTNKESYEACQYFADHARKAGGECIHSLSVRCPSQGKNIALISWKAFRSNEPETRQTWRLSIKSDEIAAICECPHKSIVFDRAQLEDDPHIRKLQGRDAS